MIRLQPEQLCKIMFPKYMAQVRRCQRPVLGGKLQFKTFLLACLVLEDFVARFLVVEGEVCGFQV